MAIEVVVKKWGNSMGVLLPKNEIEKYHLKVNDKLIIEVIKKANIMDLFGSLKGKVSGQEFKDMVRKGWE